MTQYGIGTILVAVLAIVVVALLACVLVALIASALGRMALDAEVDRLLEAGVRIVGGGQ